MCFMDQNHGSKVCAAQTVNTNALYHVNSRVKAAAIVKYDFLLFTETFSV